MIISLGRQIQSCGISVDVYKGFITDSLFSALMLLDIQEIWSGSNDFFIEATESLYCR